MRRMILVAATSSLVLALAPAGALARHNGHQHKRHHAKRHAKHHARVRGVTHRRFGDLGSSTTPTTPTTPSVDAVGTVDSFTNSILTIKLNNGTTVSGTVTNDTEIECEMAENQVENDVHRDGGGSGDSGDNHSGRDNGGHGDDNGGGDDEGQQQACTSADLTAGASVHGAELKLSSAGAVWEKVDLIS